MISIIKGKILLKDGIIYDPVSNKKNNFVIVIPYLNEKEKNTVIDKRLLKFNNVILYEKSTIR